MKRLFLLFIFSFGAELYSLNFFLTKDIGYAIPLSASYIDTIQNRDIYWNPNSGLNIEIGTGLSFTKNFGLRVAFSGVFGYKKYHTTDGRKVNTEAEAGTNPDTINVEWSHNLGIIPLLEARLVIKKKFIPYLGVGAGIMVMRSYETWDFINVDDLETKLWIKKYYPPSPSFQGMLGMRLKISGNFFFHIEAKFGASTYAMTKVVLTKYTIDGEDHTNDFTLAERTYTYAKDVADENKGGDCLLAGFNYNNYPQHKIGSNLSIKIGLTYSFKTGYSRFGSRRK